ncbi:MAG: hypothetical protein J4215_06270 [Candidatus Diapherotrites archaeon]|uniref:Uncharacterized protein n=1 Tax=Candidatus Iainarchaeum sp. TaxID=3101447 RepID=A0A8T4L5N2_9ARCH|nr:hypothetical protein [Candidatus Diapherotrites archaeon]
MEALLAIGIGVALLVLAIVVVIAIPFAVMFLVFGGFLVSVVLAGYWYLKNRDKEQKLVDDMKKKDSGNY